MDGNDFHDGYAYVKLRGIPNEMRWPVQIMKVMKHKVEVFCYSDNAIFTVKHGDLESFPNIIWEEMGLKCLKKKKKEKTLECFKNDLQWATRESTKTKTCLTDKDVELSEDDGDEEKEKEDVVEEEDEDCLVEEEEEKKGPCKNKRESTKTKSCLTVTEKDVELSEDDGDEEKEKEDVVEEEDEDCLVEEEEEKKGPCKNKRESTKTKSCLTVTEKDVELSEDDGDEEKEKEDVVEEEDEDCLVEEEEEKKGPCKNKRESTKTKSCLTVTEKDVELSEDDGDEEKEKEDVVEEEDEDCLVEEEEEKKGPCKNKRESTKTKSCLTVTEKDVELSEDDGDEEKEKEDVVEEEDEDCLVEEEEEKKGPCKNKRESTKTKSCLTVTEKDVELSEDDGDEEKEKEDVVEEEDEDCLVEEEEEKKGPCKNKRESTKTKSCLTVTEKAEVCSVSKKSSKPVQSPSSYISQFLAEQKNRICRKNSSSSDDNYEDDDDSLTDDSMADSDYIPKSSDQESSDNMFENYLTEGDKVNENLEESYISESCSSDASEIILPIALPALHPERKRNCEMNDCQVSSSDSMELKKVKKMLKAVFPPSRNPKEENPSTSAKRKVILSRRNTVDNRIRNKGPQSKEENLVTSTSGIVVQSSSNTSDKRVWDKKHYCYFCGETSTNITKHYFGPHKEEPEVKEILSFPLKSKRRKLELMKLRNAGDFNHNVDVLKKNKGTLVTWSRKSEDENISSDNYLPCEDCLGFFLKSNLWRHRKVCPFRKETTTKYGRVQSEASLLLPCSVEVSEGLRNKIISKMINDEIKIVVRNDRIINKVGEKLYKKHGHLPHLHTHISQKMRELARFLIAARKVDPEIQSISDVIHPQKFIVALNATQVLCSYSEDTNQYGNPSLALKMGHQLKKCAKIKKSEAIVNGDFEGAKRADQFLSQIKDEWSDEISSPALQTLASKKMNKGQLLPLAEDIKILQAFLNEKTDMLSSALQKSFTKSAYATLNQITLARLVLFNRRRGGETERITVKSYLAKLTKNDQLKEIEESLTPVEKMLCSTFERVEIRGKKGRTVPVLLTPSLQSSIDLLLKWRNEAEIHKDNPYVFARPNFDSINPIRSSDVLRKFANDAGLSQPENVTSTKLRKHVATVSQILNLRESDMEAMANFLGHDIEIHRSFYRLPQETIQIARMGRLLSAFDKGIVSNYSGKSLDEIPLNDDIELSEDDEDEEKEEEDVVEEEDEDCLVEEEEEKKGPCKNKRKVQRLTDEQGQILKRLFRSNVTFRKELNMKECMDAIQKNQALRNLDWKKVKNTVHNWITLEKRKTAKLAHKN